MSWHTAGAPLGHDDIMCLAKAPSAVYMLVAAVRGTIDDIEPLAFTNMLRQDEYEILLSAVAAADLSPSEMLQHVRADGANIVELLHRLNAILRSGFPENIANVYKVALFRFAKNMAERARHLSDQEQVMGQEEKAALLLIFHLLELREVGYV